jgi:hypothetical protein
VGTARRSPGALLAPYRLLAASRGAVSVGPVLAAPGACAEGGWRTLHGEPADQVSSWAHFDNGAGVAWSGDHQLGRLEWRDASG